MIDLTFGEYEMKGPDSLLTYIWKYDRISGYWKMMRDCYADTAEKWLIIFRGDEPMEIFKQSKRRPIKAP